MSPSQRLSSHVGVQTDMMTEQSWTFAHSCLNDKDPTPIIPFVIGADALKGLCLLRGGVRCHGDSPLGGGGGGGGGEES